MKAACRWGISLHCGSKCTPFHVTSGFFHRMCFLFALCGPDLSSLALIIDSERSSSNIDCNDRFYMYYTFDDVYAYIFVIFLHFIVQLVF